MTTIDEAIQAARGRGVAAMHGARELERRIQAGEASTLAPRLLDELDSPSPLSTIAALALARSGDPTLVQRLMDFVAHPEGNPVRRSHAVDALGDVRAPGATLALAAVLEQVTATSCDDEESPRLTISLAVALAKMGDNRGAPVVLDILSRDAESARRLAANALKIVTGAGMVAGLEARLNDPEEDITKSATDALFLLGDPRVVDVLLDHLDAEGDGPRWARLRVNDLIGAGLGPDGKPQQYRAWWKSNRSRFMECVCHRSGKPMDIGLLLPLLDDVSAQFRTRDEFEIITGLSLEGAPGTRTNPAEDLLLGPTARDRLDASGLVFKTGGLYKWGQEQDLRTIFGA